MGRQSHTQHLSNSLLGQHLALSVAAHLARTQLVPDPLNVYDSQHLSDTLDAVGNALARVAPLFVPDPQAGAPRQLMEAELQGARVKRSATILLLSDGRSLSGVSIKRADLRQAIAILKAVGIQELAPRHKPEPPGAPPNGRLVGLRASLAEIETLLRLPLVPAQVERANRLIVAMARNAPDGRTSNLAMRLMSALHELREGDISGDGLIPVILARLRAALDDQIGIIPTGQGRE
jgi:hypothetical protein